MSVSRIEWAATSLGYIVVEFDANGNTLNEYRTGNHVYSSTDRADPDSGWMLPEKTIREFAETTAKETAGQHKVPLANVSENTDLEILLSDEDGE